MKYDVVVIGSGLGGYVTAIRAAQLGRKACVIEKSEIGGTCLNRGCIPAKALVASANVLGLARKAARFGINAENVSFNWTEVQNRKNNIVKQLTSGVGMLLKSNKIDLIKGEAIDLEKNSVSVKMADGSEAAIEFDNAVIATGSVPSSIPGIAPDGRDIITSDEILQLQEIPKSLLVVGGGVIGIEFACIMNSFGCRVTVIEMLESILPAEDLEISAALKQRLMKDGIDIKTGTTLKNINKKGAIIEASIVSGGEPVTVSVDRVLISTGRKPSLGGLRFKNMDIKTNKGFISVNGKMQTNIENIYAIGDITGISMLAHSASAQGIVAAENICGRESELDCRIIPNCIYSNPEVASVGLTEEKAKSSGHEVKTGKFPFIANGRALTLDETYGFTKVIVDKETDALLGMHIIGPEATELIMQGSLGLRLEIIPEEFKRIIYAHPTLSESVFEAMHDANNEAIDIARKK